MTNQNGDNILKTIVEEELNLFFENLDFKIKSCKIDFEKVDSDNKFLVRINLTIDNPEMLIGEGGDTLIKIQHILKIILRKKMVVLEHFLYFYFNLDINNYKEKKEKSLQKMAQNIAEEVVLTGKERILEIMPSYERRIVHLALKDNDKISTESVNDGRDKRVIIKLKIKDF